MKNLTTTLTTYLTLTTGPRIFYRTAGLPSNPTVLLLHGYPSSSHQFRHLIPLLSPHYRVLAPDLPSFGFTSVPQNYTYTFANIASTIATFLAEIPDPPAKYSMYLFDYGAPTGFRLAMEHPDKVQAIVSQNGNAYEDGFGAFWDPVKALWENYTDATRTAVAPSFELNGTLAQYFTGVPDPDAIEPESYSLDQYLLDRSGAKAVQMQLLYDYHDNVALYPAWQAWMRESNVPVLAVWGKKDVIFVPAGAEAFKRDSKNVEVEFLDTGHFALETNVAEVAELMVGFLKRWVGE